MPAPPPPEKEEKSSWGSEAEEVFSQLVLIQSEKHSCSPLADGPAWVFWGLPCETSFFRSGGAQNSRSGGVRRVQLSSFRERRSIEVENRLVSRVLEGSGSRSLGNPHALAPARASARRLGRHHFGVGTWGLRRRSLRKPRESPRPRGRRLIASRTRTWGFGGHNSPNALALMRFEHQIP